MLIGAIDIGSNAVRFLVTNRVERNGIAYFNRVEYMRYPLRLGEEVFASKPIPEHKIVKLTALMHSFSTLFGVFEVQGVGACATSAMRQASNSTVVVKHVLEQTGIDINIISGTIEADLLHKALVGYIDDKSYIHIDVGGGSTEINIFVGKQKIAGRSFEIGTVRAVQGTQNETIWHEIQQWISQLSLDVTPKDYVTLGTGGNIRKIYELCQPGVEQPVHIEQIRALRNRLAGMRIEERMFELRLNQDRADVIIPAADIYLRIMDWCGSHMLIGPQIGLIDGIAAHVAEHLN